MPTPEKHATLSASAAHRWLICTASPRFEEQFPDTASEYAAEGTLAHAFCELKVQRKFQQLNTRTYNARLNKLKKDALYNEEMEKTSDAYIEHLTEKAMTYSAAPTVNAEVRVDFSEYVPDGFGTCDCIMVGGDTLDITDYKHGKGVIVSAVDNPQMRLYALGALKRYMPVYGDTIKRVRMAIFQPRAQADPSVEEISREDLIAWGESIKPIAQKAFAGLGEFKPGDHCRFCKGRAQCKARADMYSAFEDFKDCVPAATADASASNVLTNEQVADLLIRAAGLVKWYEDLQDYALKHLLNGGTIPGWKVVAGRSLRAFSDADAAIAAVIGSGYDEAVVYDRKPKTLAELEKLMGKPAFEQICGPYIVKPLGKPTLAPETDKRPEYSAAAADFAEVVKK